MIATQFKNSKVMHVITTEEERAKRDASFVLQKYGVQKTLPSMKRNESFVIDYLSFVRALGVNVILNIDKLAFYVDYGRDEIRLPSIEYMEERLRRKSKIDEKYEELVCMGIYFYITGIAQEKSYIEVQNFRTHYLDMKEIFYERKKRESVF